MDDLLVLATYIFKNSRLLNTLVCEMSTSKSELVAGTKEKQIY
jgi:hypothetical protein